MYLSIWSDARYVTTSLFIVQEAAIPLDSNAHGALFKSCKNNRAHSPWAIWDDLALAAAHESVCMSPEASANDELWLSEPRDTRDCDTHTPYYKPIHQDAFVIGTRLARGHATARSSSCICFRTYK